MMRWLEPDRILLQKFLCFCAPSPPPAPDYVGAARQQGEANIEAARTSGKINNPNVISPYGTQTVEWGGGFDQAGYDKAMQEYNAQHAAYQRAWNRWASGDGGGGFNIDPLGNSIGGFLGDIPVIGGLFGGGGRGPKEGPFEAFWPSGVPPTAPDRKSFILKPDTATIIQKFSPEQQRIYDQQVRVKQLLGGLGEQGATALRGVIGRPLNFTGIPGMPRDATRTRNKVINAMMARVNQDTDVARKTANSKLIAAGIRPGTTAYENSMRGIDRLYNDARNQAFLASGQEASRDFELDAERRRQAITELLAQRQIPLNEITALMSGSQVQNPFAVPGFSGTANVQPSPLFAAQNALSGYNTDIYNAQAAGAANQQAGAMGMGTSIAMMGLMAL